jgi:NADH:ubiquinone reductase (H+-translocating)
VHRVVIIGGGFAGLSAARRLKNVPVDVTLIDRCNYHLFQPLLYQVATGALSPANIASPLRNILKSQRNVRVLLAEATAIDVANHRVELSDGAVDYDTLVVATGSSHQYFGHDEWEQHAPGLKTIEDATDMRRRILLAFEMAEREPDPAKVPALLTFVIVGGGPTGAELAGALAEIARDTLRRDFRKIDPSRAQIILVEGTDRVLPAYPPSLSAAAQKELGGMGVAVRTSSMVVGVAHDSVTVREGNETKTIPTHTILWAAGVLASPLGRMLSESAGAAIDKSGRVIVESDCTVAGHPDIFVIGDLANFSHQTGQPLPGVAQPAIQQGTYVAKVIKQRLRGEKIAPFHYWDKGNLATLGRGAAVADLNWLRISGLPAWLLWIFIHLLYIVEFQNRLLVFIQWGWFYFTYDRSARLITGKSPLPLDL